MRTWTCFVLILGLLPCGCGKQPRPTAKLVEDLSRPQERDRLTAVRTLPQRKGEAVQVVPALIEALKDTEGDVRRSAALGLGSFGEQAREAVPALQAAPARPRPPGPRGCRHALARIDPGAAPKPVEKVPHRP